MNKKRKRQKTLNVHWAAASALALLLVSCQSEKAVDIDPYNTALDQDTNTIANSPQQSYLEDIDNDNIVSPGPQAGNWPLQSDNSATEASSFDPDTGELPESVKKPSPWSASSPVLKGIAIGDSDTDIIHFFGQELDRYQLEEERIDVLEYDGFSVGFNGNGHVHFVEVYGKHVAAGLNDLQIGDKPDKALTALGTPETQTDYMLTYAASGALLKLDIDPAADAIVSIKLLAQG